jgi:NTE family protein
MDKQIGLILTGGGARAAYQVGVLKAIAEMLPRRAHNPFPIICGTSAGALNAAVLSVNMRSFRKGVRHLDRIWKNFSAEQVYRTDLVGVFNNTVYWLAGMILSGFGINRLEQLSLLDNTPLIELLEEIMPCEKIQDNIDAGLLRALSITASGYGTGESVTFYQGAEEITPWQGTRRIGVKTKIENKHLLASAALPFLFPAIQINREYFGDGSMRQIAPISSAMQLGATSILVIGVNNGTNELEGERNEIGAYPSLAQIAGHALNSIFLDSMEVDLERVRRINDIVEIMPEEVRLRSNLKKVNVLVITPSQSIEKIATHYAKELPWTIRIMLRLVGGTAHQSGATLLSYLLSEGKYCKTLIDLGYRDAMNRREEIREFLEGRQRKDNEMPQ